MNNKILGVRNSVINILELDAVVSSTHYVYKMLKDGMMNPDHDVRMSMNEIKVLYSFIYNAFT